MKKNLNNSKTRELGVQLALFVAVEKKKTIGTGDKKNIFLYKFKQNIITINIFKNQRIRGFSIFQELIIVFKKWKNDIIYYIYHKI